MTPIDDPKVLRHILANTEALLLDFDGPVCSVFAGLPATLVASRLNEVLIGRGHSLPTEILAAVDPFRVLVYAAALGSDEARSVEAALTALEVEAVQSARQTHGVAEVVQSWTAKGRRLGIVSNNSLAAVNSYIDSHHLRGLVTVLSARVDCDVAQLKPSPTLLASAVADLRIDPPKCAFVGDSVSDILASDAVGTRAIGFANRSSKVGALAAVSCEVIITEMRKLAD